MTAIFKPLVILLVWIAVFPIGAAADELLPWTNKVDVGLAQATKQNKPVVLEFTASWCRYCKMMKDAVIPAPPVQQALSKYVRIRVDADKRPDIVANYRAYGLPTFIRLEPTGKAVSRLEGYQDKTAFRQWLVAEVKAAVPEAADARPDLAMLRQQLAGVDPLLRLEAEGEILNRCTGSDDAERLAATPLLYEIASKSPKRLLPALNAKRLAVRIVVANALSEAQGESFTFDPWESQADRDMAMAKIRKDMSSDKGE
jgi:thioredoxin-like negative regulator of GroEL